MKYIILSKLSHLYYNDVSRYSFEITQYSERLKLFLTYLMHNRDESLSAFFI
jgi:hypothetical protein